MAGNDNEGCLGCLGLLLVIGIIWGIFAAFQAYASAVSTQRIVLALVAAVPTGLVAGGLVGWIAGKYRQKAKLGPLPFLSCFRGTGSLRKTYLPNSESVPSSDENPSAEQPVQAEVVDAKTADAEKAGRDETASNAASEDKCPKCGFSYKWDGVRCGHCQYVATHGS
jgi:hypothetical protein